MLIKEMWRPNIKKLPNSYMTSFKFLQDKWELQILTLFQGKYSQQAFFKRENFKRIDNQQYLNYQ